MVWVFVDNTLRPFPQFMLKIRLIQYVALASVLYHEVGHHIHAVHRRVYEDRENVAEDWSRKLSRQFFLRRYGYPVIPFGPFFRAVSKFFGRVESRRARRGAVAQ
jgi:hypothetical protein